MQLGASVSAAASLQELPLILAARMANLEAVETLLEARANIDGRGAFLGQRAIHAVIDAPQGPEQEQTCAALLRHNPDLLVFDLRGRTVLHASVLASNLALCERFVEAAQRNVNHHVDFPDVISTADFLEARCTGTDAVAAVLSNDSVSWPAGGWTALHYAVATGASTSMVDLLLRSKCNPRSPGSCDWTPLHLALSSGNSQAVLSLLDAKACPDAQTSTGLTPLVC